MTSLFISAVKRCKLNSFQFLPEERLRKLPEFCNATVVHKLCIWKNLDLAYKTKQYLEECDLQCFTYKINLTIRNYCECLDWHSFSQSNNDDFPVILSSCKPHSERPCCALSLYWHSLLIYCVSLFSAFFVVNNCQMTLWPPDRKVPHCAWLCITSGSDFLFLFFLFFFPAQRSRRR